ncbi:ATP-binding protein [Streptomyces chartreusis]|uniref:ATP-binding protein n=1 Tax=Streptomyces chartreusis TaxID=1969 RepID=UPI003446B62C
MADTLTVTARSAQHSHAPVSADDFPALPLTLALPHCPQSVAGARRFARAVMIAQDVAEDLEDTVLLLVSELVTNAIEHAAPPLVFHLDQPADDTLRVSVDDGGPVTHHDNWHATCTDDEHGRGTTLIAALADQHGAIERPDGHTTHWATLKTQNYQ